MDKDSMDKGSFNIDESELQKKLLQAQLAADGIHEDIEGECQAYLQLFPNKEFMWPMLRYTFYTAALCQLLILLKQLKSLDDETCEVFRKLKERLDQLSAEALDQIPRSEK